MRATFRHINGSKKGLEETFDRSSIRIGRDPGNDLKFDPYIDRDASGFHAEVYEEDGKVWVRDVGSTNGTYVEGKKIQRCALEPGNTIGFGRNGPKLEFLADGASPAGVKKGNGEGAEAGAKRRPGMSTIQAIVREAVKQERGRGKSSGGTAVFVREAVQKAVGESTRRNRLVIGLVVVFFSAAVVTGAIVFWSQWTRIRKQEDRLRANEAALVEARQAARDTEEILLDVREQSRDQFFSARQEEEERERERAESRKRIARLEKKIALLGQDDHQLEALRRELAKARNERVVFQKIQKENEPSILLIYTSFVARGGKGKPRRFQAFGTGFIATREGHVITNKHVVQPWKFAKFKKVLDREGLTVDLGSVLLAAWCAGSRVYTKKGGAMALNLNAGYNTHPLKNLEILNMAADHMDWVTLSGGAGDPDLEEPIKVHAHKNDNNDLAILKILDRFAEFRSVKLASAEDIRKMEKLDPVLSLGFPRGGALLEKGVAEPSTSRGHIRKIETSILISAPIIGGNSGGPIFSETGAVIGVSTRTVRGAETFGLCIPIPHAVRLLPPEYR